MARIACFVTCFSLCAGSALAQVATPEPVAGQVAPAAFPEGAKIAFVNLQVVFDQSALGKETFTRLRSFDAENGAQLQSKASELQDLQSRLESQRSLLSPDAVSALAREVEFKARQLQFDRENVQIRRDQLQQELLEAFNRRVLPEAEKVRASRGLWMILSVTDAGVIAADPGLDLSGEVIRALDAAR